MMFKFDESKVSYDIECRIEPETVRGNAMCSGDDDYDRQVEDSIIADVINGNDWAWCSVRVVARYDGIDCVEGDDWLGCCSYASEADFKAPGGYYDDMCRAACDDLRNQLEGVYNALN